MSSSDDRDYFVHEVATWAKGTSPGRPTLMPSAMVRVLTTLTGLPAASEAGMAAAGRPARR